MCVCVQNNFGKLLPYLAFLPQGPSEDDNRSSGAPSLSLLQRSFTAMRGMSHLSMQSSSSLLDDERCGGGSYGDGSGEKEEDSDELEPVNASLLSALLLQVWSSPEDDQILISVPGDRTELSQKFSSGNSAKRVTSAANTYNSVTGAIMKKISNKSRPLDTRKPTKFEKAVLVLGLKFRTITSSYVYNISFAVLIVVAALLELVRVNNRESTRNSLHILLAFQAFFSLDIGIRIGATAPNFINYFENMWNIYELICVSVLWIALAVPSDVATVLGWSHVCKTAILCSFSLTRRRVIFCLGIVNIFRLLRIANMMSWITELHVVLQSIWTSLVCILFVIFLMAVSYYPFAVIGVLLYGKNDKESFGTVPKAFATLLEVARRFLVSLSVIHLSLSLSRRLSFFLSFLAMITHAALRLYAYLLLLFLLLLRWPLWTTGASSLAATCTGASTSATTTTATSSQATASASEPVGTSWCSY
jgi:hypothetical protein